MSEFRDKRARKIQDAIGLILYRHPRRDPKPRHCIASLVIVVSLMLTISLMTPSVRGQDRLTPLPTNPRDLFFERLLVGGSENGLVYLELPLRAAALGG